MNNFRIGPHFMTKQPGFRILGDNPNLDAWPYKAREVREAFKTFVRWDVTNVSRFLPMGEEVYTTVNDKRIDIMNMVSLPPFPQIWMESAESEGSWAIILQADVTPGRVLGLPLYWPRGGEFPYISDNLFAYEWDDDGIFRETASRENDPNETPETIEIYNDLFGRITNVMGLAFIFAHCKNVTLEEKWPSRQVQRTAVSKGEPVLKWHEIVIDPSATRQPSTGANRTDDTPKRSLHIARGHFAHYTEDRPLFGKHVGTFWRPAHVRGSADVGVVKSTYKVKPGT